MVVWTKNTETMNESFFMKLYGI